MRRRVLAWVALLFTLCACGADSGDDAGDPDAAADAGADGAAPYQPAAPAPPALPVMTPCPAGWREVDEGDGAPVRCDPWPESGQATCADDEAHFPGSAECATVGTPCGDGDWATDLPEDGDIVYVKAGAVGGNGLEQNPFGDLQRGVDVASARGAIVAISKGTFDGLVDIAGPVTLWGACTAETILTRTEDVYGPVVAVIGPSDGSTIRNLSITGEDVGVYAWDLDSPIVLDGLVIQGKEAGIYLDEHTDLQATNLLVHDTAMSDAGTAGYGLSLIGGAQATVTHSVFLRNHSATLGATSGSSLVVRDTAIVDSLFDADGEDGGVAIEADDGSHVVAERVAIVDASLGAVVVLDPGTIIEATDLFIQGVLPGEEAGGILALYGGRFVGRRVDVSLAAAAGIKVVHEEGSADLEDVIITDTVAFELQGGIGLGVGETGVVEARRIYLARNAGPGILVEGEGSSLVAEDVSIFDTTGLDSPFGMSVSVTEGSVVDLTRLHAARGTGNGILALGAVNLVDALVESANARAEVAVDGWGIGAYLTGRVDAERLLLRDHFGVGIWTALGGRFIGRDVLVDLVKATPEGISTGILSATPDSPVELTRFVLSNAELCGVQVAEGGAVDLHDGEIRGNPIGANVQDAAFDLARIQDGVRYIDNGTPLDTSALPVPSIDFGL